jgi:hypothetical protein
MIAVGEVVYFQPAREIALGADEMCVATVSPAVA